MKTFGTYLLAAMLAIVPACTYPFEADMKDSDDVFIIEGSITIGSYSNISVSKIIKQGEVEPGPVPAFTVKLESKDGDVIEATGKNPYLLDTRNLSPDKKYRLRLTSAADNSVFTTDWTEVLGSPEVDNLKYEIEGNTIKVKISLHSDNNPYFCISYDEQWEYDAWVWTDYIYNTSIKEVTHGIYPYYTCWGQTDATKSTTISAEAYIDNKLIDYPVVSMYNTERKISKLYKIILKASLIPEESYRYWQNLDKISKPDGDLFSPIPSSMRGNIYIEGHPKKQVLGYIGFAAAKELELYIDNSETNFYKPPYDYINYILSDKKESAIDRAEYMDLYARGYWPFDCIIMPMGLEGVVVGYIWVNQECVDCRRQGGTTQKPANWGKD